MNSTHHASLEATNEATPGRFYLGRPEGRVATTWPAMAL
jgi:hypothetical protein